MKIKLIVSTYKKEGIMKINYFILNTATLLSVLSCTQSNKYTIYQEPLHDLDIVNTEDIKFRREEINKRGFSEPTFSDLEKQQILDLYKQFDPQKVIPKNLLENAILYYHWNLTKIDNKNYLGVIDFSKRSSSKRWFTIDTKTGVVHTMHMAHGSGSENGNGYSTFFSNKEGTHASSLGYYLTAETYYGSHELSLKLDGLSDTNSNVRSRSIVIHGADYVDEEERIQGNSWGCLAISYSERNWAIPKIKGGSIIYADLSAKK